MWRLPFSTLASVAESQAPCHILSSTTGISKICEFVTKPSLGSIHSLIACRDTWNSMFLRKCCNGLTFHQFPIPPQVVLDLGCGTGYWVIEAAKHWRVCCSPSFISQGLVTRHFLQSSTIIGYDVENIQPCQASLYALDRSRDLARRVKWVHGNLCVSSANLLVSPLNSFGTRLDGLSFSSNYFDLVRISGLGLAIPEDEVNIQYSSFHHADGFFFQWQYVLEVRTDGHQKSFLFLITTFFHRKFTE
jgi:SAM-dependent methyltransferase